MSAAAPAQMFVGSGDERHVRSCTGVAPLTWVPFEGTGAEDSATLLDHPSGYIAQSDLVAAVNTALLLGKPLLLTGNPGTGKSQLAERLAWEFGLSPVLRFEAQSLSEAADLFYRFDLLQQLTEAELARALHGTRGFNTADPVPRHEFISFGPLGKAILRAAQLAEGPSPLISRELHAALMRQAFPADEDEGWKPKRSVVLVDEIDKASRDFPNDVLNAVERLEFRIRELGVSGNVIRASQSPKLRPVIIITSNGERELPAPFLRRCIFFHIDNPTPETLKQIVWNRVLSVPGAGPGATLPKLYEEVISCFLYFQTSEQSFGYQSGPAEVIDWCRAIVRSGRANAKAGIRENEKVLAEAVSAAAKSDADRKRLLSAIHEWATPAQARR